MPQFTSRTCGEERRTGLAVAVTLADHHHRYCRDRAVRFVLDDAMTEKQKYERQKMAVEYMRQENPMFKQLARKHSKISVRYTDDHGDSNEWCAKCLYFIEMMTPNKCDLVFGSIDPDGWCMLYENKS
jgi:hypothetical protein